MYNEYDQKRMSTGAAKEETQLYRSFLFFSLVILCLCLSVTLMTSLSRERKGLDGQISTTASCISSLDSVKKMLTTGYPDKDTIELLDRLSENFDPEGVVLVSNRNGLRFYQTDRAVAGDTYVDGDEEQVLMGAEPYITTVYGTRGRHRCAFHAVRNDMGTIIGYVMASIPTEKISVRQIDIIGLYIFIFICLLFGSMVLTKTFLSFQESLLMGYRPGELLNLYIRQDEVINSIAEGIAAVDLNGEIMFANRNARMLLIGKDELLFGRPLKDLMPDSEYENVLRTGEAVIGRSTQIGVHNVFVNEVPIKKRGSKAEGVLVIMNDRTEMLRISDELSGARSMMDTLRAFNHEFLNKLHVILGYLQTGEIDRAKEFIINSNLVTGQAVRNAANAIRVSRVLALIIGKMMHAAELGIQLILEPESEMFERDLILPEENYVTIIGNLIENAIEELNNGEHEVKEIRLGIYCRGGKNMITCEDTGNGIDPAVLPRIYEKGVTSKGENHGTGLFLIKNILDSCGGEINIDTEEGEGTLFTVLISERTEENVSSTDR